MADVDPLLKNVPPHSVEAERAVLGALMIDPSAIDDVAVLIQPEHFYRPANAIIYTTVLDLWRADKPVDVVLLNEELAKRSVLEQVGGTAALAELTEAVPTSANSAYYAKIVRDHAARRDLIRVTAEVQKDAFDTSTPTDQLLDRTEKRLFEVTQQRIRSEAVPVSVVVEEAFKRLKMIKDGLGVAGLPSGFVDIDELTQGFQPGEMTILAARPSMGKCVAWDTEIVLADGSVATIEELHRRRDAEVLTLDDGLKLRRARPSVYVDDGVKPVFRVTTRLGRVVETTASHPFLTLGGWRPLVELAVGVKVAVPRVLPVFGTGRLRPCEVKLLGFLIGDGGLTSRCPHFTSARADIAKDFLQAVDEFGGVRARRTSMTGERSPSWRISADPVARRRARRGFAARLREELVRTDRSQRSVALELGLTPATMTHWVQGAGAPDTEMLARLATALGVSSATLAPDGDLLRRSARNRLTVWLDRLGLMGKGAHDKAIPAEVFRLERSQVALFLNRLFATDGWVSTLTAGQVQVGYASVSERLARQVSHLLLRFGVVSKVRRREVAYQGGFRVSWQVDVTDPMSIRTFLDEIGVFGKGRAVSRARHALVGRREQTNRDLIPVEAWSLVEAAKGDEPWSALGRRAGLGDSTNIHAHRRALSRPRLGALAAALAEPRLAALATSDVTWDEVVSIEPAGEKQVYDLTIPGTHNFVANDVCVHNTSIVLNMLRNVTVYQGKPAVFFSLEMPRLQVTSNILCSLARIDGHRLRGGYLTREEERQFLDAAEILAPAPLFIDDTPGLSTMELRAKVRRLKSQHDISFVVIDYLQLMSGSDRASAESRQMEVSEISRMIKALARELSIPIMALAQLSRKVEERKDHKPMMSDLRESGCLAGDTLVSLADSGRRVPIRELVGRTDFDVWALNTSTYRLERSPVSAAFSTGVKPVFKLTTRLGRSVRATANHRFHSFEGWRRLDEMEAGVRIALPCSSATTATRSSCDVELQGGQSMADGGVATATRAETVSALDVSWDEIVSIEPDGEEEVFDLTVPELHSFVANDIVVHNSIEQDADVIMLLFRPEYYEPDKEELKNKAEVIVAKNRNGPVGEVKMAFFNSHMRFESLTRM